MKLDKYIVTIKYCTFGKVWTQDLSVHYKDSAIKLAKKFVDENATDIIATYVIQNGWGQVASFVKDANGKTLSFRS